MAVLPLLVVAVAERDVDDTDDVMDHKEPTRRLLPTEEDQGKQTVDVVRRTHARTHARTQPHTHSHIPCTVIRLNKIAT